MGNNYTDEKEDKHLKTRAGSLIEISKERKPGDPDFEGYCMKFSIDKTNESIGSDSFDWQFEKKKVFPMLYQHQKLPMPIGRIEITEKDIDGWRCKAFFNETEHGKNARICVLNGDLTGLSVGFYSVGEEIVITDPETGRVKEVKFTKCELFEVSVVVSPAHDEARILAVNKEREKDEQSKEMASILEALKEFNKKEVM